MAKILHFFGITNVIFFCLIACLATACDTPGWFGEGCKYKCHCDPAKSCGKDGSCSKCEKWWFGLACQYADLMKLGHITTASAKAGDGKCESYKDWIHIKWETAIYLTWLRLTYRVDIQDKNGNKIIQPDNLTISYYNASGSVGYFNLTSALVDSKTIDIYCYKDLAVTQVNISGPQLTSLCTVQISGGRNVALKQLIYASESHGMYVSSLAVDGDASSDNTNGLTCYQALPSEYRYHRLKVNLPTYYEIYQYVLYNSKEHREHLKGFQLKAEKDYDTVFTYFDTMESAQLIYNITSNSIKSKIRNVEIGITRSSRHSKKKYFALCEIEIFGDRECPPGYYGRDCENQCNCAVKGETCFFSTGICPSGCPLGYHHDGCQKSCGHGYYGISCLQSCDFRCLRKECDKLDGRCVKGCEAGFLGDRCKKACKAGTYGMNCTNVCPINCNDEPCDIATGDCFGCKNGYTGDRCDKAMQ